MTRANYLCALQYLDEEGVVRARCNDDDDVKVEFKDGNM